MTDRTEGNGYVQATPAARPALESWLREHGTLEAAAAAHPDVGALRGRGRVLVVPAPDAEPERWVVRHYHRGGAIAPVLGDRYLRIGTPRPLRELRVGWALEARGIPTPAHLGAAVYPSGVWYRGDLVTRWVPGSRDLAAVLFPGRTLAGGETGADGANGRPFDPEPAMHAVGRVFRQLHEAGVAHPDLNLKNLLVRPRAGGRVEALVLDLDGAEIRARLSAGARRRMIARFWRSARKWQEATGVGLDASLEAAFEAGYGTGSQGSTGG